LKFVNKFASLVGSHRRDARKLIRVHNHKCTYSKALGEPNNTMLIYYTVVDLLGELLYQWLAMISCAMVSYLNP
jgi:hypothetical protein